MNKTVNYIKGRLEQKSTWAGFAGAAGTVLAAIVAFTTLPQWLTVSLVIIMGVSSFAAVIAPK